MSYNIFFFLISFFTCVVNQAGSVLRAFINLLGTCSFARAVILSMMLSAKLMIFSLLRLVNQFELDHLKYKYKLFKRACNLSALNYSGALSTYIPEIHVSFFLPILLCVKYNH